MIKKLRTATKIYISGEAERLCEKYKDDRGSYIIELIKVIEEALEWQEAHYKDKKDV